MHSNTSWQPQTLSISANMRVFIFEIDIDVENTMRRKLKMRPYNSMQMSSLRIRCYVFSVISVHKVRNVGLGFKRPLLWLK